MIQLFLGKQQRPIIASCDKMEESVQTSTSGQIKFKSGSCDKAKMTLQTSDQAKSNKRNCCPYCFKLQSKLARHIVDKHSDQNAVQDLLKFSKGNFFSG